MALSQRPACAAVLLLLVLGTALCASAAPVTMSRLARRVADADAGIAAARNTIAPALVVDEQEDDDTLLEEDEEARAQPIGLQCKIEYESVNDASPSRVFKMSCETTRAYQHPSPFLPAFVCRFPSTSHAISCPKTSLDTTTRTVTEAGFSQALCTELAKESVSTSECMGDCSGGTAERAINRVETNTATEARCSRTVDVIPCDFRKDHTCDCVGTFGDWTPTDCTTECGKLTVQTRELEVTQPATNGGACNLKETRTRPESECPIIPCPVDCEYNAFGPFPECDVKCGDGSQCRTRTIKTQAANGGKECDPADAKECRDCTGTQCPSDCHTSEFGQFGQCSVSCGGGTQTQTRTELVAARFGGKPCENKECTNPDGCDFIPLVQRRQCNTDPCPIDCQVSEFSPFTPCSQTCAGGTKTQTRKILVQPAHGGKECPELENTVECNDNVPCNLDCKVEFGVMSQCHGDCGMGFRTQEGKIVQEPRGTGKQCPPLIKTESCFTGTHCPIDCKYSNWTDFGDCSASCGPGMKTRTRTVEVQGQYGGEVCDKDLSESAKCNEVECPVDCVVGPFTNKSSCSASCGGGFIPQERKVLVQPRGTGDPCPSLEGLIECNTHPCPINCVTGPWKNTSSCSKSCGGGTISQEREVLVSPAHGGHGCGSIERTVQCNTHPCSIDCKLGEWYNEGGCSKSCGGGSQKQRRKVLTSPQHGGHECGQTERSVPCNTQECDTGSCSFGPWSDWDSCHIDCETNKPVEQRTSKATSGACPPKVEKRGCELPSTNRKGSSSSSSVQPECSSHHEQQQQQQQQQQKK